MSGPTLPVPPHGERPVDHRTVGLGGLEPPTSSLSGKRSNRLSYRPAHTTTAPRFLDSRSHGAATIEVTAPVQRPQIFSTNGPAKCARPAHAPITGASTQVTARPTTRKGPPTAHRPSALAAPNARTIRSALAADQPPRLSRTGRAPAPSRHAARRAIDPSSWAAAGRPVQAGRRRASRAEPRELSGRGRPL